MSIEKIISDLVDQLTVTNKTLTSLDSKISELTLKLDRKQPVTSPNVTENNVVKKKSKKVEDQANKIETTSEEKVAEPVKVESTPEVVVDVAYKVAELQREGFLVPNLKIALTSLGVEKVAMLEGAKKLQFYKFLEVISSEEIGKDIFNKMTSSQIKEQIAKCEAVNV